MHIYNTLSGKKELFKSHIANKVSIYVCGITAYDMCHLGHLRVAINFDIFIKYMQRCGYKVKYVRNITDIDDKIIQRAQEEHKDFLDISRRYSDEMQKDYESFGLASPDFEPRATSYVKEMIALIKNLEQSNIAYLTKNGDICYRVRSFNSYGKLSHKKIDELRSGIRVEKDESKEDPLDFVLWKSSKPGEPAWDSPWGKGRPGWHIECSAMIRCCLGTTIDIHGGGRDLIFPHHENEIAQSESAHHKHLANYWMHCGHLMINGKKMSKSLNNFITIRDVLRQYDVETVKYFMNSAHYRTQLDFSPTIMKQAHASLERLYRALESFSYQELISGSGNGNGSEGGKAATTSSEPTDEEHKFYEAMDDDFNTPKALSILFNMAKITQKHNDIRSARSLRRCGNLLGILCQDPAVFLKQGAQVSAGVHSDAEIKKIEKLLAARDKARQEKNWDKADELRKELDEIGVTIEDTDKGGIWRVKSES